jgi:glyoxylase-like metal-dependent hydrolase (beta-lactamase superfamily II)
VQSRTHGRSYRRLRKPSWQPPDVAFSVVWTALYADVAVTSTLDSIMKRGQPRLRILGATDSVTGSKYLVEAGGKRILVDCRLFQGYTILRDRNRIPFHIRPRSVDAVILTHTHRDHTGYMFRRWSGTASAGPYSPPRIRPNKRKEPPCRVALFVARGQAFVSWIRPSLDQDTQSHSVRRSGGGVPPGRCTRI